jgi:hypothetical protein
MNIANLLHLVSSIYTLYQSSGKNVLFPATRKAIIIRTRKRKWCMEQVVKRPQSTCDRWIAWLIHKNRNHPSCMSAVPLQPNPSIIPLVYFFKTLNLAFNENYMRYRHLLRRKLQLYHFIIMRLTEFWAGGGGQGLISLCRTNITVMCFPPRRKHAIPQGSNLPNNQLRRTLPSVSPLQSKRGSCLKQTDK